MNQSSFGHTKLRRYFRISWFEISGALFSSFLAADLVDRIRDPYTAFLQRLLIKKMVFIINSTFAVNFNLKFRFKRHNLKMYLSPTCYNFCSNHGVLHINIIICISSFKNTLDVTNAKFDKWNVTKKNPALVSSNILALKHLTLICKILLWWNPRGTLLPSTFL